MTMIDQQQQQVNTQTNIANASGPVYTGTVQLPPPPVIRSLHQIPAPPDDFVGREEELAAILAHFEHSATITGVRGMGGVGKSTLAFKVAQRLEASYPDAQLYVHLRGASSQPLTAVDAMQQILRAFHPDARLPEQEAELLNCYRSTLYGQRVLLLLDDAADRAQVEPLLPPTGCAALITSRQTFALPGLKAANLDTLPPDKARELLLEIAARIGGYADELARACGYLPLALRAVGSALAERPDQHPAEYARRLQDARARLSLIDASLTLSYDLLSPDLQARWAALAVFPSDFDAPAAAAVWELEPDAAHDTLSELLRYSLVQFVDQAASRPGINARSENVSGLKPAAEGASASLRFQPGGLAPGRYRLHDLARVFANAKLSTEAGYAASLRHATYYEGVLRQTDELYLQGNEQILAGLALFDREWVNIRYGQQWAAGHAADDDAAARLSSGYPDAGLYVLQLRLTPRQYIPWLEAALAANRRLRNRTAEGVHLGNLGVAYEALGDARRAIAYHEQALVISRAIRYRRGEGNTLGNLGVAYADLGDARRAIDYHEQWLVIAREIGDRRSEGNALGGLGLAYADLGDTRRAIDYHEQWLVIAREIGDRRSEGSALGGLGIAYKNLGDARRAIDFHEQWLAVAREIGDRRSEGAVLGNLGVAYADLGDARRAIDFYEQQLVVAREIGDRRGEGNALWNLSLALDTLGDRPQAMTCAAAALTIYEQIEDPHTDRVRRQLTKWQKKRWWQFWK